MNNFDHHNRFFVKKESVTGNEFRITGEEIRHLKVKRLHKGDYIIGLDGSGGEYIGKIEKIEGDCVICGIEEKSFHQPASQKLYLCIGTIKSAAMSLVCEKAAELGVWEIIPLACRYSNRRLSASEIDRLNRVALSGMKQSGRYYTARVRSESTFDRILDEFAEKKMLIALQEGRPALELEIMDDCLIFIGPEGGFTEEEVDKIASAGGEKFSLGEFRLRSETAAIAACSIISLKNL